jgi:hypothetical protein
MKTLEKLRQEHARRPIEGADPREIEKRFPKREDLMAEPGICVVENCHRESFRGQPRCRECHLQWIAEREAESERLAEEYWKRRSSKGYAEEEAKNTIHCIPHCQNCGTYTEFGDRRVELKPKERRPIKPSSLSDKYWMVCKHCAAK